MTQGTLTRALTFYVPLLVTNLTSIPDSFSTEELQAMLAEAKSEDECHAPTELTNDKLWELAGDYVQSSTDLVDDRHVVFHKAIMIQILHKMFDWHMIMANNIRENHDCDHAEEMADGWARDAGKLQAILNILESISMDDTDFLLAPAHK